MAVKKASKFVSELSLNVKTIIVFTLLLAAIQTVFIVGHNIHIKQLSEQFTHQIEMRVALDLPALKLENQRFGSVTDVDEIRHYIGQLNDHLVSRQSPVLVTMLQGVTWHEGDDVDSTEHSYTLGTVDRDIQIVISPVYDAIRYNVNLIGIFLAIGFAALYRFAFKPIPIVEPVLTQAELEAAEAQLVINLHNKTISNGQDDQSVALPNKPFCFYVALVDYCLHTEKPYLNHSKNVPEEIVKLADKYFYRLIELGHTKRKRPDFSTNLDKTLSEIRAALDEVYLNFPRTKAISSHQKHKEKGQDRANTTTR